MVRLLSGSRSSRSRMKRARSMRMSDSVVSRALSYTLPMTARGGVREHRPRRECGQPERPHCRTGNEQIEQHDRHGQQIHHQQRQRHCAHGGHCRDRPAARPPQRAGTHWRSWRPSRSCSRQSCRTSSRMFAGAPPRTRSSPRCRRGPAARAQTARRKRCAALRQRHAKRALHLEKAVMKSASITST
jgi:hypothetical protein